MSWKHLIFGNPHKNALKPLYPLVERVNSYEDEMKEVSDEKLRLKTNEFKDRLKAGENLDDILPEAFAVVREASDRTLGMRHFDVQVLGGIALHQGNISEMKTGEGKTLMGTMPVYLNALAGQGVHVITVNDYLARRDAVWMGQVYEFLGLSVGIIASQTSYVYDPNAKADDKARDELGSFKVEEDFLRTCERRESYACDITYGTNNEFGFDYLRDNIEYEDERLRQRDLHFAVIDEIDSVLIDEARTPLIISAPAEEAEQLYKTFSGIASKLNKDEDYVVDEKFNAIEMTDAGIEKAEKLLGVENLYTESGIKNVHHLENAVRAKALYQVDRDYVVKDNEVVIVDQFTGRLQPGRRWSEGLHQAVEAKEGVELRKESRTFASITFQNYFRQYDKLGGMTGTAVTSAEEFMRVYGMNVVEVPTNRSIARDDKNDLIFQTEHGKFTALARTVKEFQEKGQPVLVGTISIEKNEHLTKYFDKEGVKYELLNAKNHEREGNIVAQAGRKGAVTIATNMAGRGVDIKLGGNPSTEEEYEEIKSIGGLVVIGTERHEARRIDNQLRGRAGRQGDPGVTQFFVSLEDNLMRVFASDAIKKMMGTFGIPEDEPIENGIITRSLETAQTKIEGFHFDARKRVLEYDNVLNTQRQSVYKKRRSVLTGDEDALRAYLKDISWDEESEKVVEEALGKFGDEAFIASVRKVILQTTDLYWMEHLEVMDHTRSSVNLRAYGQRDPLVEYKKEGLRLFKNFEDTIFEEVIKLLPHVQADMNIQAPERAQAIHPSAGSVTQKVANNISRQARQAQEGAGKNTEPQKPIVKGEEIGRNEQVTIEKGGETQVVKYKKAQPLLEQGWKIVKK